LGRYASAESVSPPSISPTAFTKDVFDFAFRLIFVQVRVFTELIVVLQPQPKPTPVPSGF
jgi:hypothetical protein